MKRSNGVENFFARYAFLFNRSLHAPEAWVEETAQAFAECFINAGPGGIQCGKNDEVFREVIPQGFAFYKSIGIKSMTIKNTRVNTIDAYHALAKVRWEATREKEGRNDSVEFEVYYFVRTVNQDHKIFGYITGDEQALFREKGWV